MALPALLASPPTVTKTSFRRGDTHAGVWAIQVFLNDVYEGRAQSLEQDGIFGYGTDQLVRRYQADTQLGADGVVGVDTQARMVRSCIVRSDFGPRLPKGLLEGQIRGESGNFVAAANSSVRGGIDLGYTQRRVYGPPFDRSKVALALDPVHSVSESAKELYERAQTYSAGRHPQCPFNKWELAVLHHNWPVAAQTYYKYGKLPQPNRQASWAPASLQPITWDQWAHFYVHSITKEVSF